MDKLEVLSDMSQVIDPNSDQIFRSLCKKVRLKKLTDDIIRMVEEEVVLLLHAHRDALRNRFIHRYREWQQGRLNKNDIRDPRKMTIDINDAYYGDAFGILRCLARMGYGYFGPVNLSAREDGATLSSGNYADPRQNFAWWLENLIYLVLEQEHYNGDGTCSYCMGRWGKDDSVLSEKAGEPIVRKKDEPKDVHTEHCCAVCGCKYFDENCSVVTGKLKQTYSCGDLEQCGGFKDYFYTERV